MNVKWHVWLAIVVIGVTGLPGLADDSAPQESGTTASTGEVQPIDLTETRAEIHRTLAALIEARAAEEPNEEQIAELSAKLIALRTELRQAGPAAFGPGWQCPLGQPARDWPRPAWGGSARRGYGPGAGRGYGPGAGRGYGPGAGRGYGPGAGRGYGQGRGYGPGTGARQGFGPGW